MRSIILFFTFIGVILITVGYVKTNMQCPPPLVKFKYIPKTFDEEQNKWSANQRLIEPEENQETNTQPTNN